jgi:hypothetical protein
MSYVILSEIKAISEGGRFIIERRTYGGRLGKECLVIVCQARGALNFAIYTKQE